MELQSLSTEYSLLGLIIFYIIFYSSGLVFFLRLSLYANQRSSSGFCYFWGGWVPPGNRPPVCPEKTDGNKK